MVLQKAWADEHFGSIFRSHWRKTGKSNYFCASVNFTTEIPKLSQPAPQVDNSIIDISVSAHATPPLNFNSTVYLDTSEARQRNYFVWNFSVS